MINISEVQIRFVKPRDGLIGFASLVISDSLFLGSIAVHEKLDGSGYRLTFPTKGSAGKPFHIFHPINARASHAIERAVFAKIKDVMKTNDRHHCHHAGSAPV